MPDDPLAKTVLHVSIEVQFHPSPQPQWPLLSLDLRGRETVRCYAVETPEAGIGLEIDGRDWRFALRPLLTQIVRLLGRRVAEVPIQIADGRPAPAEACSDVPGGPGP